MSKNAARKKVSVRQHVPAMRPVYEDLSDTGGVVDLTNGYDVFSWSPGKVSEGVASTEVHLVMSGHGGVSFALRMKSPRALDELVGVLLAHRKYVWGDR